MRVLLIFVILLAGCAGTMKEFEQEQAQKKAVIENEKLAAIGRITDAELKARFVCVGRDMCEKAFKLTKLYVMQNAGYKIARSDDMSISTHSYNVFNRDIWYRTTFGEQVYMSAVKVPVKAPVDQKGVEIEQIVLKADCGEFHEPYRTDTPQCVNKVIDIYNGYKPFIDAQM